MVRIAHRMARVYSPAGPALCMSHTVKFSRDAPTLKYSFKIFIDFFCITHSGVCLCACMPWRVCRGHGQFVATVFFPFTTQMLAMNPRPSGLDPHQLGHLTRTLTYSDLSQPNSLRTRPSLQKRCAQLQGLLDSTRHTANPHGTGISAGGLVILVYRHG